MGWQVGFRWAGDYYCYVVVVNDPDEAVEKALAAAFLTESKVTDLTCICARGGVYKA